MTRVAKTLLIALAAATAAAVFAAPAEAGRRAGHDAGPVRVTVRPWAHPHVWPAHWYGDYGWGWGATALYGRAARTTVYPYGRRGDAVRAYWYPGLIYSGCRYGARPCW